MGRSGGEALLPEIAQLLQANAEVDLFLTRASEEVIRHIGSTPCCIKKTSARTRAGAPHLRSRKEESGSQRTRTRGGEFGTFSQHLKTTLCLCVLPIRNCQHPIQEGLDGLAT